MNRPVDSPFCACMDDDVIVDFRKVLSLMAKEENGYKWYTDLMTDTGFSEKYLYALLTIADNSNLIEHGTTIRGSWLIEKGKQYLTQPQEYTDEWETWSSEAYSVKEEGK